MTLPRDVDAKRAAAAMRDLRTIVAGDGNAPALLEERHGLTVAIVKAFVHHGGTSMQPFRNTEIFDAELDALTRCLAKQ